MSRIFKDKDGKVIKTEPHTKPHPRPCARDSKGKRLFKRPEELQAAAASAVETKANKSGGKGK